MAALVQDRSSLFGFGNPTYGLIKMCALGCGVCHALELGRDGRGEGQGRGGEKFPSISRPHHEFPVTITTSDITPNTCPIYCISSSSRTKPNHSKPIPVKQPHELS